MSPMVEVVANLILWGIVLIFLVYLILDMLLLLTSCD